MKRRRFLVMTGGGLALVGAGAGGGLWLFCPEYAATLSARAVVAELARSMTGAASAGRAWRRANPKADPASRLLDSLDLAPDDAISADEVAERLGATVEADFARGRIFEHESWWLSETEARLAALHVELLGSQASEVESPGFGNAPEADIVSLSDFNPKQVEQGEPINHPGLPENVLWFATAQSPPPRFVVYLADKRLTTTASENGFSVRVPDTLRYELFETPGEHEIWLYDPVVNRRQRLGALTVRAPSSESAEFCPVTNWGPRKTRSGQPFNEQPDGASAFWLRIECFPKSTVVLLEETEVPTTLRPGNGLITTHIEDHALYREPGEYTVALKNTATGQTKRVGTFVVEP